MRFVLRACVFFLLACASLGADVPVMICLPGGQLPAKLVSNLGPALAPWKPMAFLSIRDLEEVLPTYPGAPIITAAAYARYNAGYAVILKGKRGESTLRKYLLVTAKPGLSKAELESHSVGILDFLGREKIPVFVRDAFGLKFAQLKRVSKKEDLLSLLGMESVDLEIVAEDDFAEMKASTKLPLVVLATSKPMDAYPALIGPRAADLGPLKTNLMNQPKSVLKLFDIEGWE